MKPVKFSYLFFFLAMAVSIILCWLGGVNGIAADNPNHSDNDGILQAFGYAVAHGNVLVIFGLVIAAALALWVIVAAVTGGLSDKSLNDRNSEGL